MILLQLTLHWSMLRISEICQCSVARRCELGHCWIATENWEQHNSSHFNLMDAQYFTQCATISQTRSTQQSQHKQIIIRFMWESRGKVNKKLGWDQISLSELIISDMSSWSYCSAELNGLLSTALFLVHQEFVFDVVIRVDHLLVIDISWCLRRQWWLDIYEFLELDCWRWLLIVVDEVKGPGKYHHLRSTVWNNFNHRHVIITLNIEQMWW